MRAPDTLFGSSSTDRLQGESGADLLNLASGDVAFGGSGGDAFQFGGQNLGSFGPLIRDFDGALMGAANGEDSLVFTSGLEAGSFAYIEGEAFSGGNNSEARCCGSGQRVQVDQDGDGSADLIFRISGLTSAGQLAASDFLWF